MRSLPRRVLGGPARLAAHLGLRPEHEEWMTTSALVALCALLAVAVLILPLFGPQVAAASAVTVVLVVFALCYFLCIPRRGQRRAPSEFGGGGARGGQS